MPLRIAQLKKLRGKSVEEIRERSRQELAKLSERVFHSATLEMSDAAFVELVTPAARSGSGEAIATRLLNRLRSAPAPISPAPVNRQALVALSRTRFAPEHAALLDRADRACAGRFDLLGLTDLRFGDSPEAIDWHLDPVSGKHAPLAHWTRIDYLDPQIVGDKKIIWELNRHAHFVTFGQAYILTNDDRYVAAFIAQVNDWVAANPVKLGINWASSLELALRAIAWLWALGLMRDCERLTPQFLLRCLKSLVAHGQHIESYLSHYFSPNTHLTGEALGLLYLGLSLPELADAARWRMTGLRILLEQLPRHIRPDGVYYEQSSCYHRYTADFYLHLLLLSRAYEFDLPVEVKTRLTAMLDHLMWLTRPDGKTPLIGDDDGGRLLHLGVRAANDFRDTLATGAALLGRSDWKFVAGEVAFETLWLMGGEGLARYDALPADPPTEAARLFPNSGWMVMRDGWTPEASYVLVDGGVHGGDGCGHAHADALAFELAAHGQSWLIDAGTFTYTGDVKARDAFRSTAAHNTVTVDEQSQSQPGRVFSWQHIARTTLHEVIKEEDFDFFRGTHDGYERLADAVTHTRSLLFVKRAASASTPVCVIVRDQFDAKAHHRYAAHFHFSPACQAAVIGDGVQARLANGAQLHLFAFASSSVRVMVQEGWVSEAYAQRAIAPVARVEIAGQGRQEIISVIVAHRHATSAAQWPNVAALFANPKLKWQTICERVGWTDASFRTLLGRE